MPIGGGVGWEGGGNESLLPPEEDDTTEKKPLPLPIIREPSPAFIVILLSGLTVRILNISSHMARCRWNLGDGTFSTAKNPVHTYDAEGVYNIGLTVWYGSRKNAKVQEVLVTELTPQAAFTATGLADLEVFFKNTSNVQGDALWDFGDGSTSTEWDAYHTYAGAGTYIVTLTVGAYTDTQSVDVVASFAGLVDVVYENASGVTIVGHTITHTSEDYAGAGSVDHAVIDDGTIMECQVTTLGNDGSPPAGLAVEVGLYETSSPQIPPIPDGPPSIDHGFLISANNSISIYAKNSGGLHATGATFSGGDIFSIVKSGNDAIYKKNGTTIYTAVGDWIPDTQHFLAYFIKGTGYGGSVTNAKINGVIVFPARLVTRFSASSRKGTAPLEVTFTDTSVGSPTSWLWDFGDGAVSTEQNPTHIFVDPGIYLVTSYANNDSGQSTRMQQYITVDFPDPVEPGIPIETPAGETPPSQILYPPVASFTANHYSGVASLAVDFTDTTTGLPDTWDWDFGDGGDSSSQNPSHTFTTNGIFVVRLTVTKGIWSSTYLRVIIVSASENIPPVITAVSGTPSTGFAPLVVAFSATITGEDSVLWDFGDGSELESTLNAQHGYLEPGVYTVGLTAMNDYGYAYAEFQILVLAWAQIEPGDIGYYIVDTQNDRILMYEADGTFIASFGGHGMAVGQFDRPTQLTIRGGVQQLDRTTF